MLRPSLPPYRVQSTRVRPVAEELLVAVAVAFAVAGASRPEWASDGPGPSVALNAPTAPTPRLPPRKSRLVKDLDIKAPIS